MAEVRLAGLRKEFDGNVVAVDDLTLTFAEGTVTCLLGPSGCGKTTLVRMIAGLETPTSGQIFFGEHDVTNLKTRRRDLGMVFQSPVVYRGTTVRENVALPLRHERLTNAEAEERIERVLSLLGLDQYANTHAANLDYATRQKVAVARAIARRHPIVLFDEPITNVDIGAKLQLKRVLKELFTTLNQTVIYVTHDQTEAMTLADQIALMHDGRIEQLASPRDLYSRSESVFAGWFLGNPGMNFIERSRSPELVGCLLGEDVSDEVATVGFRPEDVDLRADPSRGGIPAVVDHMAIVTGGQHLVTLRSNGQTVKAKLRWDRNPGIRPGCDAWWSVGNSALRAFDLAERIVSSPTALVEATSTLTQQHC